MEVSIFFWIGKINEVKCIVKFWTMIIGITSFICSYSIRSEIITSVYNNPNVTHKSNYKFKIKIYYLVIVLIQFILLIIWSFTQRGLNVRKRYLKNVGYYDIEICSIGNEYILSSVYCIDYLLLVTKKIYLTSLISCILLLFCHLVIIIDIENIIFHFIVFFVAIFIIMYINITFVGPKLLLVLNTFLNTEYSALSGYHTIRCQSKLYEDQSKKNTKFFLDTYDVNNNFMKRYSLNYNYDYYTFNEFNDIYSLSGVKTSVICSEEDINKNDYEKDTILLWDVQAIDYYIGTAVILIAFPIWYEEMKKRNKTFCMEFYAAGWDDNVMAPICDDDHQYPCPDIIVLGTGQLTIRYNNDDIIDLNKYFQNHFLKTGISFESILNKYSLYDYRVNGKWLAIPYAQDFRVFRFNITTFDYCISQGYDLHYPPWTWEKAFEYAGIIKDCTSEPGFQILFNYGEDLRFFVVLCQALGIPFFSEDSNLYLKKCGFRNPEYVKKLNILKELVENHNINMWLDEAAVKDWQEKPYPKTSLENPIIPFDENLAYKSYIIHGMMYDNLYSFVR
ncbi:hypothetical protein BCR32DRAFT_250244 [Anaeromyces robustus]|uniref:Uncharacterized protein n=1 Tax=Anaeromyces robustus TaxID=1754192 RepID=A0A1Y1W8F7_9FUNG|nr:hypothetical protein BCR32DRAFT_250244 [Anaeromyces robustus]|eukprot:ORX69809.1 hypothetical protein BCR32DRAFT_250244 [Anaeromyces robustus]